VREYTRYGAGWRQKAERIAWRICKTWLEAQITLINLEQAKLEEVFLPYLVIAGDKTLFETMEQNQFLLPGKKRHYGATTTRLHFLPATSMAYERRR
jgi:hypothetical protein